MRNAPDFDRARSALVYNDKSRDLILKFKHADRTEFAFAFANWVSRAGETELEECDAVAPVPLHWTKLFERRFNQSALLAKELGRRYAKPVELEILQRPKRGMSQGGLSRSARRKNVVGAFVVAKAESVKIEGKRIVLVDDVLTTGSTMNACARALKRAGARTVVGLTLARVVGPTGSPI
jgi:ComF family protein